MNKILYILLIFLMFDISIAEELFVGYLKPYVKKSENKQIFKRRDPTEEPIRFPEKLISQKAYEDKEEKIRDIELKAILYHPIHKKAYINDILVSEGEVLNNQFTVKEIGQDYVKVEKNKKIYTLKIEEGDK